MAQNAQENSVGSKASAAGPKVAKKQQGAAELVSLRNRFFYVNYRKLSLIFIGATVLCIFSLLSALYFATRSTPPVYVPLASNGQVVATYPLSEPSHPNPEVMTGWVKQWALDGARKAFTYDYINFGEQLNESQSYFTYRGWDLFLKGLTNSQNFNTVQQQQMIVKFTPRSVPIIKAQEVRGGRLTWALQFEGTIEYVAHKGSIQGYTQNVNVNMVLVRMSTVDSPKGLGIDQVVIQEVPQGGK